MGTAKKKGNPTHRITLKELPAALERAARPASNLNPEEGCFPFVAIDWAAARSSSHTDRIDQMAAAPPRRGCTHRIGVRAVGKKTDALNRKRKRSQRHHRDTAPNQTSNQ